MIMSNFRLSKHTSLIYKWFTDGQYCSQLQREAESLLCKSIHVCFRKYREVKSYLINGHNIGNVDVQSRSMLEEADGV